jgi:hypothetical protein
MTSWTVRRPVAWIVAVAMVPVLSAAVLVAAPPQAVRRAAAEDHCPPGFRLVDVAEMQAERLLGVDSGEGPQTKTPDQMLLPRCLNTKHPESFGELAAMQRQRVNAAAAPFAEVTPGAFRAALAERDELVAAQAPVAGAGGSWEPYGQGPLISNDERFGEVNGTGLVALNGRVDSFAYDEAKGRLFALIGTGGVWMSEDLGETWVSVGDTLPTQIHGAIGFSPEGGSDGTLLTVGGEHLMGGNTYTGLGAFWSSDLGRTWHQAEGVPDGAMGFQVEVDPTDPSIVYAATSMGLFRSTDIGKTYENVTLPTSEECAGKVGYGACQFANFVTDVVVKVPGGIGEEAVPAGTVVAAVGYRAGQAQFPDGTVHSPGNGIYRSETGEPGSFSKLEVSGQGGACGPGSGFAPQQNIGRTELGIATGPEQDHDYLYAEVEDAELFNGGVPTIDIGDPGNDDQALHNTSFGGIYVSADFGASWSCMADTAEVAENPLTGSGLAVVGQAQLFAPGVQAWYNQHIDVDPTRATEAGVPTRITFGLEELWINRATTMAQDGTPQDPRGDFVVIAPYFADEACLLLTTGAPACPSGDDLTSDETTAHPDHHAGIWIPDGDGGVAYVSGHDGGVNVQRLAADQELDDAGWGEGDNDGFNTLLPYHARIANDGTVWYGLQDNGSGKIEGDTRAQFMTFGGDGFFVAVDPANADYAWSETTLADMRYTTDGGATWVTCNPPVGSPQFSNPFVMDPQDANHLMTAGPEVVETVDGPETCGEGAGWVQVFDLGSNEESGATNAMSAVELEGDAAYVGYCGVCDIINNWETGFSNGIATNVGGDAPPEKGTANGWHKVDRPAGLPNRYITGIEADPADPSTVYVTLGGYANREWVPPGSYLDANAELGEGHVFKSTDAGETFTDISGNLPNVHATWVVLRPGTEQIVVGTEQGVFISSDAEGSQWSVLGDGLPLAPVTSLQFKPDDPDLLIVSTFGRGVYSYDFEAAQRPQDACDADFVPDPGFDDIARNTHRASIECIAWYLIAQGKGDIDGDGRDEYDPSGRVTRGQMASYLAHLATDGGLRLPASPPNAFRDDNGSVHERNINSLAALDLVEGVGGRRYEPRSPVTRAQMASFIARLHERVTGSLPRNPANAFTDDNGNVHEDSINALAALGVVRGVADRNGDGRIDYAPGLRVLRDQMATFVINDLLLFVDAGEAYAGGARVTLADRSVGRGGVVSGRVRANKQLVSLRAEGCGVSSRRVSVADDGRFTQRLPDSQAAGRCTLRFRAATTNRDAGVETQRITYPFTITVE